MIRRAGPPSPAAAPPPPAGPPSPAGPDAADFVWFAHQPAVTRWLKAEVARDAPGLRFAYARPGLTTFKVLDPQARGFASAFARARGTSLGRVTEAPALAPHLAAARAHAGVAAAAPVRLHVFARDVDVPLEQQDPAVRGARARAIEAAIRAAHPEGLAADAIATPGDAVLDVIVPHASEPDEPWFVGTHAHGDGHGPYPGGTPGVVAPPEAPSRAWSKIEEALRWSGMAPAPGEVAVELGSAPGGASWALLQRGLTVIGVDPGAMDPRVLEHRGANGARFIHLAQPAAEVDKRALPHRFEWLLLDVNLAPMIALKYVERFVALAHGGLRGAALTLKLNDDGVAAALPSLQARVRKLGAVRVDLTQLPSHRSEIVALLRFAGPEAAPLMPTAARAAGRAG